MQSNWRQLFTEKIEHKPCSEMGEATVYMKHLYKGGGIMEKEMKLDIDNRSQIDPPPLA